MSNYEIIKAHYAASDRKDIAGMLEPLTATTEWTEMAGFPCAGTYIGPDAVFQNVFKVLGREWVDYTFTLERLIDGGESIIGVGTYSGTCKKTSKAMQARVVHVWDMENQKVKKFEQFTDTLLVAKAMT